MLYDLFETQTSGLDNLAQMQRMQAMNADRMAEYIRWQGNPTGAPLSMRSMNAQQNAWPRSVQRPTMTLAEWDRRRAAFRPAEGQ